MAFSTVVAFNRFPERASIHTVAFHRLALVGRGNNLGGFSQYDRHFYRIGRLSMGRKSRNTSASFRLNSIILGNFIIQPIK